VGDATGFATRAKTRRLRAGARARWASEKIVVDHPASTMSDFLTEIDGKRFLLVKEILGAAAGASREIILAGNQLTMIRPLNEQSAQGSNFRPKR
jgi:hypothetical protein